MRFLSLLFAFSLLAAALKGGSWSAVPLLSEGRFKPLEAHASELGLSSQELVERALSQPPSEEAAYKELLQKAEKLPPGELAELLRERFPLRKRLQQAGDACRVLPSRFFPGEWYDLKSLALEAYSPSDGRLVPLSNFTCYPDSLFARLQESFSKAKKGEGGASEELAALLLEAYGGHLAGKPYLSGSRTQLFYPTLFQLKAENFYLSIPWIPLIIACYLSSAAAFLLGSAWKGPIPFNASARCLMLSGFFLNSLMLALRCCILGRPPVATMSETLLYVPWISALIGFFLGALRKGSPLRIGAPLSSALLLAFIPFSTLSERLETIPPVLNSQFWLSIHVLMVVGSYGAFLLSSVGAHLYLLSNRREKRETPPPPYLEQSAYIGLLLLIPGTLLGGVWAAQSWGRFWDWDPKEAWAFISICTYLLSVHAYRYKLIGASLFAVGSILGFQAITFTWYGVNYLLGTGFHSYGFGSGGVLFYLLFLFSEALFLLWVLREKLSFFLANKKP